MNSSLSSILTLFASVFSTSGLSAAEWYVDDDASAAGVGTTWETAFDNLQDALAAASSGHVIFVADGIYYPDEGGSATNGDRNASFQLINGVQIRGGYPNGGGTRDLGSHRSVLSGDIGQDDVTVPTGDNSYTVVTGSGTDGTAVLDGFTITAGLADAGEPDPFNGPTRAGGGMYSTGGSPTLNNCTFANNKAGFGGGLFETDFSSPTLTNCLFHGNKATFFGGGINNRGVSSPVLINCTLTANSADSSSGGGAITNIENSDPSLTNCIIWNNEAFGSTTSVEASVNDGDAPTSTTIFNNSVVQNINPGGTNLDGTLAASDPDFLIPGDPTAAPSTSGNFRLETGSPALDFGDNGANVLAKDIISNPRVANVTIDLGAYEGAFPPLLLDVLHVDHTVGSPGNGSSWAQALATLQDALDGAVSGQTILVAEGTYYPDEGGSSVNGDRNAVYKLVNGVTITGGYPNGGGSRDLAANPTILSGDIDQNDAGSPVGGNSYTVVSGSNRDSTAVLDGFILTAGLANADLGDSLLPANSAGAMHIKSGSPTVKNCILRGNFALLGGAVLTVDSSSPTFINCVVSGNRTTGFGGGFHNRDGSNVVCINTTFTGNSASADGGAIANFLADLSLINCLVWNNEANGKTTTVAASVNDAGGASTTYDYSLAENLAPGGTSFDGTYGGSNPFFLSPILPSSAPTNAGDFRLTAGAFPLDNGDGLANLEAVDVLGNSRVSGAAIDLGAIEGASPAVDTDGDGLSDPFELAYTNPSSNTSLAAGSNDDNDAFTALEEFAFGLNPNVGSGSPFSAAIIDVSTVDYLSITWRANPAAVAFVDIVPEQSLDLGGVDNWSNAGTTPISAPPGMSGARSTSAVTAEVTDFLRLDVSKK